MRNEPKAKIWSYGVIGIPTVLYKKLKKKIFKLGFLLYDLTSIYLHYKRVKINQSQNYKKKIMFIYINEAQTHTGKRYLKSI